MCEPDHMFVLISILVILAFPAGYIAMLVEGAIFSSIGAYPQGHLMNGFTQTTGTVVSYSTYERNKMKVGSDSGDDDVQYGKSSCRLYLR